jgi:phospholipase C
MWEPRSSGLVPFWRFVLVAGVFALAAACLWQEGRADDDRGKQSGTLTPIEHVIVLIGENHSFDNVFATYRPTLGRYVSNLLTKGIIRPDGSLGPNAAEAAQFMVTPPLPSTYFISTSSKTPYSPYLPTPELGGAPNRASSLTEIQTNPVGVQPPFDTTISDAQLAAIEPALETSDLFLLRTGATGASGPIGPDTRVANYTKLPNTVFQLTGPTLPYDSYTGDMVHRFYQMWQQSNCKVKNASRADPAGCLRDLYPYVGIERGDDSGSNSMGFFNMHEGDAPLLKKLADEYALSDNFHQAIMGGTAANHVALGTGDAIFWTTFLGIPTPPARIADPDPQSATTDKYKADREWSNCSDLSQPGIAAISSYLAMLPYHPDRNCEVGHFYMLNNLRPGFLPNGVIDAPDIVQGSGVPPSTLRTIGDALNENSISWAYYGGGYNAAVRVANAAVKQQLPDPFDVLVAFHYCDFCNFESYVSSIMSDPVQRTTHIKDVTDFLADLAGGTLPAVSFVKPDGFVDASPATSKLDLFEAMAENIIDRLTSQPALFKSTALFVVFDESGGYWDSGYVQPIDFFGDGPRVPFLVVSPHSRGGKVVHTYYDHASILKFIERNWGLKPLTSRSRDNLPNPISAARDPYVPLNQPAVGDLFDMFEFGRGRQDDDR